MSALQRITYPSILGLALALLLLPAPALADPKPGIDVFIEVNPNTIQTGFQVRIRASCGEDLNPASVRSRAFDDLTLIPQHGTWLMTGSATIHPSVRAGNYRVNLRCASGATATTELVVLDMARPTRGPDTGGGGLAGGAPSTPVLIAGAGLVAMIAGTLLLGNRRRTG